MGTYVLPNIVTGGQITVSGNSLADAQANAAQQTGVSVQAQQGGGTYGSNTNSSLGGGGGGGGGQQQQHPAVDLGAIQQSIVNALATGNKAAFDETVRQFDLMFGLDQKKFDEAVHQFSQTFGLQQAGVTGMYNGAPTEAHRQFDITTGLNAAQLAASLHADPFRQREVEGQLGRLLRSEEH